MRILFLNLIGALGGAERSLLELLASLRKLEPGWELHLIAGADGPMIHEASKLGVRAELLSLPDEILVLNDDVELTGIGRVMHRIARTGSAGLKARRYARQLRERVVEINPTIIHSNSSKFHVLTRLMGRVGAPVVWHVRDFMDSSGLLRSALLWSSSAAKLAVANSEATAANARTYLGRVTVRTVLNAVDTERFSPGVVHPEFLDELAGLPRAESGVMRVGLLASYARWKGHDLFLGAAVHLATLFPAACFYIIGGPVFDTQGSQFSAVELQAWVSGMKLEGRVGFVPFQNDPVNVYRALDVVVNASTSPEPFGRTIAEAMSCGRAVVSSAAGGAVELFTDGLDALSAAPNNSHALAASIGRLLNNSELRETLGAQARKTAIARFSLDRLGLEMRDIFLKLSEDKRA